MKKQIFWGALIFSVCIFLQVYSEEKIWYPDFKVKKTTWLPGEPVLADLRVVHAGISPSSFYWGEFYLDGSSKKCTDRNTPVEGDAVSIPEGGSSGGGSPEMHEPGSVQSLEIT